MQKRPIKVLDEADLSDWERAMLFQNVQRTRLSNERNFLNWVRASLAFITLGFIMNRFELFVQASNESQNSAGLVVSWLPLIFMALGGVIVALGTVEFFRVRKEIDQGRWLGLPILRDALIVTTLLSLLAAPLIFIIGNV